MNLPHPILRIETLGIRTGAKTGPPAGSVRVKRAQLRNVPRGDAQRAIARISARTVQGFAGDQRDCPKRIGCNL